MHHLERHSVEWIEIRAGNLKIRKGNLGVAKMRQLQLMVDVEGFPSHTAVWVTRARSMHFKPNFPKQLRQSVRDLLL